MESSSKIFFTMDILIILKTNRPILVILYVFFTTIRTDFQYETTINTKEWTN